VEEATHYPIDGSRMDRLAWIHVRAWPESEAQGSTAGQIADNHVRAVRAAMGTPGWTDGELLRGLRDKVAAAFGAADPELRDSQIPLLVGDLYVRLLAEEAGARDDD
jgi:hypothetical protein